MAGRLQGKTALVTAAGQGMGRAAAIAFAREGARVIATDLKPDLLAGFPAGVTNSALDVLDDGAVQAFVERTGAVDILFNCAGYVHQGTIFDCSEEDWDFAFAINVRSMFRTIRAALPKMIDNGGGSIVNMASVCSSVKGFPNRFAYGTTKAAVIGLTKSVAADFVGKGVRCNAIGPGTVETPSLHDRMRQLGDVEEARKMFVARQPMGRLATAEEIIPIVVYLASDESAFATGQIFNVDGGITI